MVPSALRMMRTQAVMVLVVVLGLAAAGAVTLLERQADASNHAQAEISAIELHLSDLENAPINATQFTGAAHAAVLKQIKFESSSVDLTLASLLAGGSPPAPLRRAQPAIAATRAVVQRIFALGAGTISSSTFAREFPEILATVRALQVKGVAASTLLGQAKGVYDRRAAKAKQEAIFGSIATILILLGVFVLFYRRAKVARAEVVRLLAASRDEASTDPLTGIGNRRAFKRDLERLLPGMDHGTELMVGMLDLDGFKVYNDTFGHAAGDALLARLAGRFKTAVAGSATAYRMGGDEFCLLAQTDVINGERLLRFAVSALTDTGEGWHIGCSWGLAWMPSEATGGSEALALADERMYAQKTSRTSAGVQTTAALVQVLAERDATLSAHTSRVAELASATAETLGVGEAEVTRIGLAAQLHDIGKTAIPESILSKPSALNEEEWAFMRRHTLIGERIIAAAPSLAHTANLVRSSHEWLDGTGYPDGLAGEDIPLGSRIIAVCDAYDAMVAPRPYRSQSTAVQATLELRRCAGTQFDPRVVDAFCAIRAEIHPIVDQGVSVVD
jgi:diguanylate cyclase (GGDEF)-like protein